MRLGDCLCKNASENFRQLVAAGLDDLVVIFNPTILISWEGSLVPVTEFVVTPMGMGLQRHVPCYHAGSLGWLPFPAHRASSFILGEVGPSTFMSRSRTLH